MFCFKCGAPLKPESPVCENCGFENQSAESETAAAAAVSPGSAKADKYKQIVGEHAKGYYAFIKRSLLHPSATGASATTADLINGIINIVITALIMPLTFYVLYKVYDKFLIDQLSFFSLFGIPHPFVSLFLKPFFDLLVVLLITNGALFVSARLMRAKAGFLEIVAKFGSFLTVPCSILVVMFVCAVFGLAKLAVLLFIFGWFSIGTSVAYTLYAYRGSERRGLDPVYAVLVTYLIVGIALYIFVV